MLFSAVLLSTTVVSAQTKHIIKKSDTYQAPIERETKVGLVQKEQPRLISRQSPARIQLQLMQARKHEMEQARADQAEMEAVMGQKGFVKSYATPLVYNVHVGRVQHRNLYR